MSLLETILQLYLIMREYSISIQKTQKPPQLSSKYALTIGGGILLGLGVGFFFLQQSALYFVGSLMAGLGVGLFVTAILSKIK